MPDLSGWRFANFDDGMGGNWQWQQFFGEGFRLEGNGWVAPGEGEKRCVWIGTPGSVLLPSSAPDKPADEAAAVAAFLKSVKTRLSQDTRDLEKRHAAMLVTCFLSAAQWHQRGFQKEANELAALLLDAVSDPALLLRAAIAKIADQRLDALLAEFDRGGDWRALAAGLAALTADFPKFWPRLPLAARLAESIQPRLGGKEPPPVAGDESALTEAQREWWQRLSSAPPPKTEDGGAPAMPPQYAMQASAQRWLQARLGLADEHGEVAVDATGDGFQETQILLETGAAQAGPLSFPPDPKWPAVLAAALGDTVPVYLGTSGASGMRGRHDFGGSQSGLEMLSAEWDEAQVEREWKQLNRPRTRGEIAAELLRQMLPQGDGDPFGDGGMSTEPSRETVREWLAENRGKSPLELARLYLETGGHSQKELAVRALLKHGGEKDIQGLEQMVLENLDEHLETATLILRQRRGEGRAFYDKLRPLLLRLLAESYSVEESDEEKLLAKLPDYALSELKTLENLVNDRGLKEVLADFAEGKENFQSLYAALEMDQAPRPEAARANIEAILTAMPLMPGAKKAQVLNLLPYLLQFLPESPGGNRGDKKSAEAEKPEPPEWLREALQQLVEADGESSIPSLEGGPWSLRDYVAVTIESVWGQEPRLMQLAQLSPEDYRRIAPARGMARLAGREPPPAPDPATVNEDRRAALAEAVAKRRGEEWRAFVEPLPAEEKLALAELLQKAPVDDSWRAHLFQVTEIKTDGVAEAQAWEALKGRALDAKFVEELLAALKRHAETPDAAGLRATLSFRPLRMGVRFSLFDAAVFDEMVGDHGQDLSSWFKQAREEDAPPPAFSALVQINLRSGRQYGQTTLRRLPDGAWEEVSEDSVWDGFNQSPPSMLPPVSAEAFAESLTSSLTEMQPESPRAIFYLQAEVWLVPAP